MCIRDRAMAKLNHPNLMAVYDFGNVKGMLFIVMEFVKGKALYYSPRIANKSTQKQPSNSFYKLRKASLTLTKMASSIGTLSLQTSFSSQTRPLKSVTSA